MRLAHFRLHASLLNESDRTGRAESVSNCELTVISQGERARRAIIASMIEPTDASENLSQQDSRTELDQLLRSRLFLQSDRLARFLRFAIENVLAGNTDLLKEYVIGTEVYDRKPPYHRSQDSIVRTEARRLREAEGY